MCGEPNTESQSEQFRLDHIDTSSQAKAFAERIAGEPKTFFLQGVWGSGKTDYLKEVEKTNPLKSFRVVWLELWKPKNKSTLARNLFEAMYPKFSVECNRMGVVCLVIFVAGSIFMALQKSFSRASTSSIFVPMINATTAITAIFTMLYGLLSTKVLDVDRFLLWWCERGLRSTRKPKVLVVDDFDRLNPELQDELYMLFNGIQGETRIIFVGNLDKLEEPEKTSDDYLGKIINQKIVLPYPLQYGNIAHLMTATVVKRIGTNVNDIDAIESLFTDEKRTLRDANHFLDYVGTEFISQKKAGKVQPIQELFIIYLYLFHPQEYRELAEGRLPDTDTNLVSPTISNMMGSPDNENEDAHDESLLTQWIHYIFQPQKTNPRDFQKNPHAYLINEPTEDHTISELNSIITSNGDELRHFFNTPDTQSSADYQEFVDYVRGLGVQEFRAVENILIDGSIRTMGKQTRHKPNELIQTVFEQRLESLQHRIHVVTPNPVEPPATQIVEDFDKMFDDAEKRLEITIGITERMYYYRTCLNLYGTWRQDGMNRTIRAIPEINEENVKQYFQSAAQKFEVNSDFGDHPYDAEALIVQLGYRYHLDSPYATQTPDFQSKVDSIEKLNANEYKAFWNVYHVEPMRSNPGRLYGSAAFNFKYHDQNYKDIVLRRLSQDD